MNYTKLFFNGYLDARSVVASFGDNLRIWIATGNIAYRENIEAICNASKKCRILDNITKDLIQRRNLPLVDKNFTLDSYLNCIDVEMSHGLKIQMDNYQKVDQRKVQVYGAKNIKDMEEIEYVSCNVYASGPLKYSIKDLFYVRKGKITKIAPYEVDEKTHKIHVDLSDIDFDDETIGLTYNYGQHFNIGASISYAIPWFMVSADFGLANKMDPVTYTKVEMTDIMNYKITTTSLKPKMFMTITPALNLKYVAVGCGVGVLYMEGSEDSQGCTYTSSVEGNTTTAQFGSSTSTSDVTSLKFMLRPSIKGFIPLSDEWSLVVGAGYDYAFKYKKSNGFNFSLGFQFSLDW